MCFEPEKKNIILLAMGGTIAGKGAEGRSSGYKAGEVSAEELCVSLRMEENIIPIQICNLDSCEMSLAYIRELYNVINRYSTDERVNGFVITHGTDTLAEVAFLLSVVLNIKKPVVITGSMRPLTARVYDGYDNLYNAVRLAASDEGAELGVCVVFSNLILSGREVEKTSSFRLNAFERGALGYIEDGAVFLAAIPAKKKHLKLPKAFPRVAVVHFGFDCDTYLLKAALEGYEGVIIEGAGDGGMSEAWMREIEKHPNVPVIRCSKSMGLVSEDEGRFKGTASGGTLSADKARILLQLLLANNISAEKFKQYY